MALEQSTRCTAKRVKDKVREGKRKEEHSNGGKRDGFDSGLIRRWPVDALCDLP